MSYETSTETLRPTTETRFGRRLGQAAGALAVVLVPLVMHAVPAGATGTANLRLTTTASSSTSIGLTIFANANLLNSTSTPTGTMTFEAFGPDDATCSTRVFTSTVAVTGTSINSARFTPTRAGSYRWTSNYSGDATYRATGPTACTDPAAQDFVDRANTYFSTAAGPQTATTISGTFNLTNGYAPTGSVNFMLTGPDDTFCSGAPVFTSTVAINGNGSYDSSSFAPRSSGKYTWRAQYTGDANNQGGSVTSCLADGASQTVTVTADPPAGDFNGTGKTQLSLFRPDTGIWYIQNAVGGTINSVLWGQAGDVPVPGDYNADGKADIAVFRPSTGQWLVKGIIDVAYGTSGDIPVPGDYNGDGKTDIAVFRPSNGTWYVKGMFEKVLGQAGDMPQPGDYDGDAKTDPTVYRPDPGTWFLSQTTAGAAQSTLGVVGDVVTSLVGVVWSLTGLLGH